MSDIEKQKILNNNESKINTKINLEIIIKYVQDIHRLLVDKFRNSENSNNYYSFSKDDKYEQLIKLKDLLDRNIITVDEFNVEKRKILNN